MTKEWNETLDRRTLVRGAAALAAFREIGLFGQHPRGAFPGLIEREKEPKNLEFPFSALDSFLIPNDRFYVRNHFPEPLTDVRTWRLRIEGAVDRPFEIGYEELRKMQPHTVTALLECAGNGRAFLDPKEKGMQWELGAVGTASWTGVPLATVLERAGLQGSAVEVMLEGADEGEVKEHPKTPGKIHFGYSLPLHKVRHPEVLLAYRMNGSDLPAAHGFPVRAIVPGWYGMASVKWLARIVVQDQPFHGYHRSFEYTRWERQGGAPTLVPLGEVEVKAQIARPAREETVPRSSRYTVYGAAWAGESPVKNVEASTDGGASWATARLLDTPARYSWSRWQFDWNTPSTSGRYGLLVRATDTRGRTQPTSRDPLRRSYAVNHVIPVKVNVL